MRLPDLAHRRGGQFDLKMTPMIDVIFLLLIFFVATASFEMIEQVLPTSLNLPGTSTKTAPVDPDLIDLEQIVVKLSWRDGHPGWQINQKDYSSLEDVGAVLAAVAGVKADLTVILDAGGNVPMEHLINVYDLCRRIGLTRIQFAASTEVPS
ncbi:MAG: biopolymer transporter ExbD [Pirellulales bacterium]|nr:biopolymer transporter ExbD [Pirellulales bacterium]